MVDVLVPIGSLSAKESALRASLRPKLAQGLIVAFSGGVDSSFLLWIAEQERRRHGGKLLAVTAVSASLAQVEREDATRLAECEHWTTRDQHTGRRRHCGLSPAHGETDPQGTKGPKRGLREGTAQGVSSVPPDMLRQVMGDTLHL